MNDAGKRIREERERLGFNQSSVGVSQKTQWAYEAGKSVPDIAYLDNFAKLGADVLYIITGQRSSVALPPDLQRVLAAWGAMPDAAKAFMLQMFESWVAQYAQATKVPAVDKDVAEQKKDETSQALPSASEVSVEKPWLPIPGRVMPAPKGDYEATTLPESAAPRIKKVVRKDIGGNKSGRG